MIFLLLYHITPNLIKENIFDFLIERVFKKCYKNEGTLYLTYNDKKPDNIKFTIPLMKNTDLISIIGSLDATKATGPDGITPKILKKVSRYH